MDDKAKQLIMAYKTVFTSESGQMVLSDLKRVGHVDRPHFTGGAIDVNLLVYDEARRALVLGIIQKVEMNLDAQVQKTAITEQENEQ